MIFTSNRGKEASIKTTVWNAYWLKLSRETSWGRTHRWFGDSRPPRDERSAPLRTAVYTGGKLSRHYKGLPHGFYLDSRGFFERSLPGYRTTIFSIGT